MNEVKAPVVEFQELVANHGLVRSLLPVRQPLLRPASSNGPASDIMVDVAWHILTKPSHESPCHFLLVEQVLRDAGVQDFSAYLVILSGDLAQIDLFFAD